MQFLNIRTAEDSDRNVHQLYSRYTLVQISYDLNIRTAEDGDVKPTCIRPGKCRSFIFRLMLYNTKITHYTVIKSSRLDILIHTSRLIHSESHCLRSCLSQLHWPVLGRHSHHHHHHHQPPPERDKELCHQLV